MKPNNLKTAMLLCLTVICSSLFLSSCSSCSKERKEPKAPSFSSGEEAIRKYRSFLSEIKKVSDADSYILCSQLQKWIVLDDGVEKTIIHLPNEDNTSYRYALESTRIRDSIKNEFNRLLETEKRSFKDLLLMKEAATIAIKEDSAMTISVGEADTFFADLSKSQTKKGTIEKILGDYVAFLDDVIRKGVKNKADMLAYYKEEDIYYRSFLENVYKVDDVNSNIAKEINLKTESVCKLFYEASQKKFIDEMDVMVYLTIRTNNRLLQAMETSIKDTERNRVKTPDQAENYVYMLLCPYSTIDNIGMKLINEGKKKQWMKLSEKVETTLNKLGTISDTDNKAIFEDMPSLLMKIIILKL